MRLNYTMGTVSEIEEAIVKLPEDQQRELAAWLEGKTGKEVETVDEATFKRAADSVFKDYAPLLEELAK